MLFRRGEEVMGGRRVEYAARAGSSLIFFLDGGLVSEDEVPRRTEESNGSA
jgi:hypothetical protein